MLLASASIGRITQQGMADMRHVDTHLMRAACLQPTFDQRCIVQNFTHLIMRDRVLSAALMLGSHFLAIMRRSTDPRSEEHTSELQSLMRSSYAVFCLKKKNYNIIQDNSNHIT